MTGTALLAILLLLAGVVAAVPVAAILAIVILLIEVVRAGLGPERAPRPPATRGRSSRHRMTWGEEIPATIEVWNRKRLPLAWLTAADGASSGVTVRERDARDRRRRGAGPAQRLDARAVRAGDPPLPPRARRAAASYELGPVDLVRRRPVRPRGGHRAPARRSTASSSGRGPSRRPPSTGGIAGAAPIARWRA